MFDTSQTRPTTRPQPQALLQHVCTIRPAVTVRLATDEEYRAARVWCAIAAPDGHRPDVAQFADGGLTHGPETIAALRRLTGDLPPGLVLIYLHRGAQAQCVHPLLPSLLHLAGHDGPAHALRRSGPDGLTPEVLQFARAVTPSGGLALIVDDRQHRLAPQGGLTPAVVHVHRLLKPPRSADPAALAADYPPILAGVPT